MRTGSPLLLTFLALMGVAFSPAIASVPPPPSSSAFDFHVTLYCQPVQGAYVFVDWWDSNGTGHQSYAYTNAAGTALVYLPPGKGAVLIGVDYLQLTPSGRTYWHVAGLAIDPPINYIPDVNVNFAGPC